MADERCKEYHPSKLLLVRELALRFYGLPYRWGGQTPMQGFDCSGLVVELFRSINLLSNKEDLSSASLAAKFNKKVDEPRLGDLAFYGKRTISHVGFFIDDRHIIEAAGGGARTLTKEDAIHDEAFVRVRNYLYRNDLAFITRPNYL